MSRPIYENAESLHDEREAAKRLERRWGCTLHKLPRSYEVDFAATRPGKGVVAWVEFKRRKMRWGQYPDIVVSARKAEALLRMARLCGKSFFVVEDDDAEIRYARMDGQHWAGFVDIGGRTRQTRDDGDIEPVVKVMLERFKRLD